MRAALAVLPLVLALATPAPARAKRADATPKAAETAGTRRQTAKAPPGKLKKPADKAPCLAPPVHVVRRRGDEVEHRTLSLTFCDGRVNPSALDSVSVLARPRDVPRPSLAEIRAYQQRPVDRGPKAKRRDPAYLSEHVMRVHPGLLVRLQRVAKRFPGKTIEIISGHRPDARVTSRHHHARALDMRVEGVSREALRDFLRKFDETGVGYYPNSYFVHMDVRDSRGYWVDRSGPGEPPDYGTWPPTKREIERASAKVVRNALSELEALREAPVPLKGEGAPSPARVRSEKHASAELSLRDAPVRERLLDAESAPRPSRVRSEKHASADLDLRAEPLRERPVKAPPLEASHDEADELSAQEIERIRREALRAIQQL